MLSVALAEAGELCLTAARLCERAEIAQHRAAGLRAAAREHARARVAELTNAPPLGVVAAAVEAPPVTCRAAARSAVGGGASVPRGGQPLDGSPRGGGPTARRGI